MHDLLVNIVLLLQCAVGQHCLVAQLSARHAPLHGQHRGKLLALRGQPIAALCRPRAGDMLHVVGIINFVGVDVALARHALIHAERQERCQEHCRAVQHKQFAALFFYNRGCFRPARQPQHKAALGGGQQLCAGEYRAERRSEQRSVEHRRRPLDQRQPDRCAKPEQVAIVAEQLVGLQQADEVCVFDYVQMARGRNSRAHAVHRQRQRQRADPARGGAARRQRRQHDPKPHHKRARPFGKQKPKQVLPDGDLHRAAHQGGNTLNGAIQRA